MAKKFSPKVLAGIVLGVIILTSGIPFKIVDTGSKGVVTRMGRMTGRVLDPGFSWKTPFIDKVVVFNTRTVKDDVIAHAATKDLQDVETDVVIVYHLDRDNIEALFTQIGDEDNLKSIALQPLIQETLKETTATFTAEELITKRAEVKSRIDKIMAEKLKNYHVILEEVAITNFEFSEQFKHAVEAKQIAEQRAKQAGFELEQAKKEAETFKLQAAALSEFTLRKMYIEKWNGVMPTTVTDTYMMKTLPGATN